MCFGSCLAAGSFDCDVENDFNLKGKNLILGNWRPYKMFPSANMGRWGGQTAAHHVRCSLSPKCLKTHTHTQLDICSELCWQTGKWSPFGEPLLQRVLKGRFSPHKWKEGHYALSWALHTNQLKELSTGQQHKHIWHKQSALIAHSRSLKEDTLWTFCIENC